MTYTLTATNSIGTVTATVKVYVLNIKKFSATPESILPGTKSKLSWDIDGRTDRSFYKPRCGK